MSTELQQDKPWFKKIRTKYDEIRNLGEKYALLRKCKNRMDPFTGNYTLELVSQRVNVLTSTLRKFEAGSYELPKQLISTLLADLEMDEQRFYYGEIIAGPAYPPPAPKPVPAVPPTPAPAPSAPKQEPKKVSRKLEIVNHTTEPFIVSVEGDTVLILPDLQDNMRKGTWVAPADMVGGGSKIVPRTTVVK